MSEIFKVTKDGVQHDTSWTAGMRLKRNGSFLKKKSICVYIQGLGTYM
jgi:hypothetical protein